MKNKGKQCTLTISLRLRDQSNSFMLDFLHIFISIPKACLYHLGHFPTFFFLLILLKKFLYLIFIQLRSLNFLHYFHHWGWGFFFGGGFLCQFKFFKFSSFSFFFHPVLLCSLSFSISSSIISILMRFSLFFSSFNSFPSSYHHLFSPPLNFLIFLLWICHHFPWHICLTTRLSFFSSFFSEFSPHFLILLFLTFYFPSPLPPPPTPPPPPFFYTSSFSSCFPPTFSLYFLALISSSNFSLFLLFLFAILHSLPHFFFFLSLLPHFFLPIFRHYVLIWLSLQLYLPPTPLLIFRTFFFLPLSSLVSWICRLHLNRG